jgi:hypothetical protein
MLQPAPKIIPNIRPANAPKMQRSPSPALRKSRVKSGTHESRKRNLESKNPEITAYPDFLRSYFPDSSDPLSGFLAFKLILPL